MGILDDAIREHLDLKRKHGARDAELHEIEDEAFGSGEQPDPFVPGELYTEGGSAEVAQAEVPDLGNEEPTRLVEPEALQPSEPAAEPETTDEPVASEPPSPIPGQVELPPDEIPGQEQLDAEPPAASESLEELIAEEEPFPEDTAAPPPTAAPPEVEPQSRPLEPEPEAEAPPERESAVPDPPPPPPEPGSEPPGRARGRVDVPTQEHPPPGDTGDVPPLPGDEPELGRPDTSYELPPRPLEGSSSTDEPISTEEPISDEEPLPAEEPSSGSDGPQLYDFETDEESVPPPSGSSAVDDDFEALGPAEEEAPYLDEEEPYAEEPPSGVESDLGASFEDPGTEVRPAIEDEERDERRSPDTEERPIKGEEEEGEAGLWFEKGPPKDFDFDD